jgi:murein DD-endopeptidase MepM/ murein hydrolase activator NlpD
VTASGIDLVDLRRHAPVGRPRRAGGAGQPRGLAHHYAARRRRPLPDLFVTDRAEARRGSGFRWFFSTCLAATVGAIAIGAVIFGSLDLSGQADRRRGSWQLAARPALERPRPRQQFDDGLAWNIPKTDRLQATIDAVSARYVVQDAIRERRANRDYLHFKPYARVLIRLAAVEPDRTVSIPPFNPLKLFANPATEGPGRSDGRGLSGPEGGEVALRVVELLGSILPAEDGQEVETAEAAEMVLRSLAAETEVAPIRPSLTPDSVQAAIRQGGSEALAPNTTVLPKTGVDADELEEEAEGEKVRVRLGRGETLTQLLTRMGAEPWQARDMAETARSLLPESSITSGHEVEMTMAASLAQEGKLEPIRYSVFGPRGEHRVTVERNAAGELVASAEAPQAAGASGGSGGERARSASLYASLYYGALAQGIPPDTIETILKIHAYEADFRRRARGSDSVELFFDLKEEDKGADGALGEMLMTSITVGGASQRFYRFKGADGMLDFYDSTGNNSRRFLLRKPLRSEDVRLTSGFGIRFHPLLNQRKLHAGIDWAGPVGTPIIAAGHGTVEEAGYKGQYGNYIRIRHANGYQTTYAHMRGFASGIRPGLRVRQGEVIGYLGSTGLSSGPHLHFEVLVGSRWVDPLTIQVPREKRLTGRQLAAFQRERVRIDELLRRPPVRVRTVEAGR